MWIHQPSTPHIILPSKSLVPGSEVAIEEVAEHFESLQEGLEVGGRLLVFDAKVDCLLQSLRDKNCFATGSVLSLTCAELSQMTARIRWKLSSVRLSFRSTWQEGCLIDLLFNQRLKNCNWTHLTKRLSSFLSRFSMRTSHDISSYFSHTLTSYLLITLPGSHPRSWGGCSCPEQRMSSDLSSSARSPGNRISLKYITWHKHQFLMM